MLTAEFDYELPAERIAQYPAPRGQSRLLRLDRDGLLHHHLFAELPRLLRAGDLLVVNDSRVLPVRLLARRLPGRGRVELLLVERLAARTWSCLPRPGRRLRPGTALEVDGGPRAEMLEPDADGRARVRFASPIAPLLEQVGHVPLPPYIRRPDETTDRTDYQTIYARAPGSIAAPTAGLHFTETLLDELRQAGVEIAALTLHVGPATFQPVRAANAEEHRLEAERYELPAATAAAIEAAHRRGGRVVAVGTTVVRVLESAAPTAPATWRPVSGRTDLFILPGFRFRAVDLLLTNFHLPRSTLLMLVCAFAGTDRALAAYRQAVAHGYRFYSYGDAMLLESP